MHTQRQTPRIRERLVITWDDINSPEVDARLRAQDTQAAGGMDAIASPALGMSARQLKTEQRPSIWYNTVFTMAFFGLLGGTLAWAASELVQLKPMTRTEYLAQLGQARIDWDAVEFVKRRVSTGVDDPAYGRAQLMIIEEAADKNPYFNIFRRNLPPAETQRLIERQHATYELQAFLAKVLGYGLIGMLIAGCLAVAEPAVDRNLHGVLVNGAVGAMLGLFGGVIVSLFVDRLHQFLGGAADAAHAEVSWKPLAANAIKYGVIGLFLTIASGVLMRNWKKFAVGLAGGLIGGIAGGVLFAPVAQWTGKEVVARAVATIAIGLVAGLATGLIENVAKTGWLKVTQGFIAGKQFILYRAATSIGSDPGCHIYLFKDPSIGRRHAAIHLVPGGFDLEDLPLGSRTLVNGRPVKRVRLRSGDKIHIGGTTMIFQEKAKPT
jgi:hypothetical protein